MGRRGSFAPALPILATAEVCTGRPVWKLQANFNTYTVHTVRSMSTSTNQALETMLTFVHFIACQALLGDSRICSAPVAIKPQCCLSRC